MRPCRPALLLALAGLVAMPAPAQWSGSGDAALVVADTLTVFRSNKGDEVLHVLVKDEILVAHGSDRKLKESNGRFRVEVVVRDGKRLRAATGWVPLGEDLLLFTFSCRCAQGCWPLEEAGRGVRWNQCVQEAAVEAARNAAATAP